MLPRCTLSPLGHPPLLRPTFALVPWHHWGRAVHPAGHSGAVPSTPSPQRGSRTLPTDFGAGCSLKAGGGTLSTTPWFISCGDPTVCQLRDRTICWNHFWAVEAARGRGNLRSGLGSWAGRILSVALGSARRQATPPFGHCPGGSSCSSGNCSHPSPSSGYSAPPPASRARPGKRCLSLQRVLFPCAKLGVWKRAETGLLSRACTLEPERRPPGIAFLGRYLEANCAVGTNFASWLAGVGLKTEQKVLCYKSQDPRTWVRVEQTQFWQPGDLGRTLPGLLWVGGIFFCLRRRTRGQREVGRDGLRLSCLRCLNGLLLLFIFGFVLWSRIETSRSIFPGETPLLRILFCIASSVFVLY